MNLEYITAVLEHARCKIIEDAEPYDGEVPDHPGASRNREHTRRVQERPYRRHRRMADHTAPARPHDCPPVVPWQ
ncbi:hypothetical protein KH990_10335 [Methanoculleus bourgensis]|nr:hypothetical protein [Methanoculleus bourgensis]MBT0733758.1 hypothetical protein [Methanoculleus bourgensis]MDD3374033.1 hypothetical protein [Methanoculleus bourgensis]